MDNNTGWELEENQDLVFYEKLPEYKYDYSTYFRQNKKPFALQKDGREFEPYTRPLGPMH